MQPKKKIFEKTGLWILKLYKLSKIFCTWKIFKLKYSNAPGNDVNNNEINNETLSLQKILKIL